MLAFTHAKNYQWGMQMTNNTAPSTLATRAYNALVAAEETATAAKWDAVAERLEACLPVLSGDRHTFVRDRAVDARSRARYLRIVAQIN